MSVRFPATELRPGDEYIDRGRTYRVVSIEMRAEGKTGGVALRVMVEQDDLAHYGSDAMVDLVSPAPISPEPST